MRLRCCFGSCYIWSGVFLLQSTDDCQFENSCFCFFLRDQCVPVDFIFLQDTMVSLLALAVVTNEATEVTMLI